VWRERPKSERELGVPPLSRVASFVDVVENAAGVAVTSDDVMRMTRSEVEDVAALLLDFYDAWLPPSPRGELRVFVPEDSVPWIDWHPGQPVPLPPLVPLLYVDCAFVPDPVSGAAENMLGFRGYAHWTLVQRAIAGALQTYRYCRPLLDSGSLVLVPERWLRHANDSYGPWLSAVLRDRHEAYERRWQLTTEAAEGEIEAIASELFPQLLKNERQRHYDLAWTDRGMSPVVVAAAESGPSRSWKSVAAFASSWRVTHKVLDSLCSSSALRASFLPPSIYQDATRSAVLATVASSGEGTSDSEVARVVPALISGRLPSFVGTPPDVLVEIRRSEEAFESWRAALRNALRLVRSTPASAGFAEEARDVLDDTLGPALNELARQETALGRFEAGFRAAGVGFVLGAIGAAAGGGGLTSAVAGAGAASAAGLAVDTVFGSGEPDSRRVLLRLAPYHRSKSAFV
jgi:hypothetical protein